MSQPTDDMLFILGAPRSGTTYLAKLVSQAFGYAMGPEGQFVVKFARRINRYGPLSNTANLRHLVTDISADMMFVTLREQYGVDITVSDILERTAESTYAGIVEAVFRAIADRRNLPRIGTKYPDFALHLPYLESLFKSRGKYLCVVRDGRDVFLSLQGVPWGHMSAYAAAKRWVCIDQRVREFSETRAGERLLCITYEELLSDLDGTLGKLELFLKISISPNIRAHMLEGADKRLSYKENCRKWKAAMTQNDQYVYEAIAGDTLRRHGYETMFDEPSISAWQVLKFRLGELARLIRINIYHARHRRRAGDG